MRERACDEGNGKIVPARFGRLTVPSTLRESGHFYFAPTESQPRPLAVSVPLRYDARHAGDECNFAEKLSPCGRDRPGWGRLSGRQSTGLADRVPDVAGEADHREGSGRHAEGAGRHGVREDRDVLAAGLRADGLRATGTDEDRGAAREDPGRRAGLRELPLRIYGAAGSLGRAAGLRQGTRPETNDHRHVWAAEGRQD